MPNFRINRFQLQRQHAAEKSLILKSHGTTLRTCVRMGLKVRWSDLTDKKPLLLLRIQNQRSDRPEICSNSGPHYFTLFEQISGQSDRWFLILSNSKLIASVSFQSTSTAGTLAVLLLLYWMATVIRLLASTYLRY